MTSCNRSGSKIGANSLKLKGNNTYDIKEPSQNNNHIRRNKIKNDISKYIPINKELEIVGDEEITKEVNLWFYPICYEALLTTTLIVYINQMRILLLK